MNPGVDAGLSAGTGLAGTWRAPGRVNLIGEHTDYNNGFALPFAIDRHSDVRVVLRSDRLVRCWSAQEGRQVGASLDGLRPGGVVGWARYPLGVLWALETAGVRLPGFDLWVDSTVPVGAGLSSSAALLAAVAAGVDEACGLALGRDALVEVCHQAETVFVGVPVGLLDQIAVFHARAGHGLLIDFESLSTEQVPLGIGPLVVVDTAVRHHNDDGAYATRRSECEAAAAALGVPTLRHATTVAVNDRLDGVLLRRARHVTTENQRVLETARRLGAGEDIADLLYASHRSLRDDFEVSCPQLDAVVGVACSLGARGARMVGGGFGGCALVVGLETDPLRAAVTRAFAAHDWSPPTVFATHASAGAGRVA